MPPREAKGRYLTREYMADAAFHRAHSAEERELYLMLALFTDDSGWLEWDADYLAFSVYRYDENRVPLFAAGVAALTSTGRLKVLKCGHAEMPKVAGRPRSGEHEYRVRDEHLIRCSSRSKSTRSRLHQTLPPNPTLPQPKPHHTARARANGAPSAPSRSANGSPSSLKDIIGGYDDIVGPGKAKS